MYYLNSNSTKYETTNELNLSDALYDENIKARKQIRQLETKIKRVINAPDYADVIFNSGATECIATCIHWIKTVNPFGLILGSSFDHGAVKDNCDVYNIRYKQIDLNNIDHIELDDRCAAVFITHVSGKTGEIMDVNKIVKSIHNNYEYLQDIDINTLTKYNKKILQYKPMIFIDATQSIMKANIDMNKWDVDGIFWSNHKIGGHMRNGVLVIRQQMDKPFVPLIAGAQNNGLRGGSISANTILRDKNIYDQIDDIEKRKDEWLAAYQYLTSNNIKVYKPKQPHLYNTLLLDVGDKCPFSILAELAKKHIYVSPKSACTVEKQINNNKRILSSSNDEHWQELSRLEQDIEQLYNNPNSDNSITVKRQGGNNERQGGNNERYDFDNALRISFNDGNQLNDYVLNSIVETINETND